MLNNEWEKNFGWSKTRQSIWDECKLKYYFNYIKKWDPAPPKERDLIWKLTKLTNLPALKGSLIHDVLDEQIKHHKIGRDINPLAAKNLFLNKIEKIRKNPKDFIIEAYNELFNADNKIDEIRDSGLNILDVFFKSVWHNYSNLVYIEHERLNSFNIQNVKVWVQLDLLSKTKDGSIVITDWKTGNENEDDDLQASVYIMWARDKFNLPADRLLTELVYLKEPNTMHIQKTEVELKNVEEYVLSNAEVMLNVKNEADFPANPKERKCQNCNFATVCSEGKKFLPIKN